MTLNKLKFAIAAGLVWGIYLFFIVILSKRLDIGIGVVQTIGSLYIGVKSTFWGAVLGFIYAFIDGFIGGYIFAWLYNLMISKKND